MTEQPPENGRPPLFRSTAEQIIVGVVTAVALAALAGIWTLARSSVNNVLIPSGAVIAFNSDTCPSGWRANQSAAGRFVVGSGSHPNTDHIGQSIPTYDLNQDGGYQVVTLSEGQMPNHSHSLAAGRAQDLGQARGLTSADAREVVGHEGFERYIRQSGGGRPFVEATGGGGAHENIPPFVALLFCEKR